jgi:hypothetical protein
VGGVAAVAALEIAWLAQPAPLPARLFQIAVLVTAVLRPAHALLILAGLGPLSWDLATILSEQVHGPRMLEQMAVAVVAGTLVRWRSSDEPSRTAAPAAILGLIALTSAVALMPTRMLATAVSDMTLWQQAVGLWRDGLGPVWQPVASATVAIEGMALLWATEWIVRRQRAMAIKLVEFAAIGYAAAACLNVHRVVAAALRAGDFVRDAPGLFLATRYNMFYDRNAAASMFVLVLFAGVALFRRPPLREAVVGVLLSAILVAVWLTGSRIALVAIVIVVGGALAARLAPAGRRLAWIAGGTIAAFVVAGGLYAVLYPSGRSDVMSFSILGRVAMGKVALRMARSAPVFGIGIGTFAERAPEFGSPFGAENAHNNVMQVLAEEGIVGLAAALVLVGVVLASAVRAEARESSSLRFWMLAGVAGFAITAMTGHPLLVVEVALPFWMMIGVLAAQTPPPTLVGWHRRVTTVACVALVIALPLRMARTRADADLEYRGVGLSGWRVEGGGARYRTAGATFALFLQTGQESVVPLRRVGGTPDPLEVVIRFKGQVLRTLAISGAEWQSVQLHVPDLGRRFERVDFSVTTPAGGGLPGTCVEVGKPDVR